MAGNKLTNIKDYRSRGHMNIGIFVFGVIFIYLVATVFLYLTDNHVSIYEVREGSILKDTAYTGFAVRSESVVTAESDGYVNYFAPEGSKVGAKTNVYTLSSEELDLAEGDPDSSKELTPEEQASLLVKTQTFGENFDEEQFTEVYSLRNNIESVIESKSAKSRQTQLDTMLKSKSQGLNVYRAASDGIIVCSVDGYEDITEEQITKELIEKNDYEKSIMKNNMHVKAGDPVYKLITSDEWTLAILLDSDMTTELSETKSVKVRFSKDNETITADLSISNVGESTIGFLTFHTAMIRYAQERYLDIELILDDESGLKIPKSSVIKKAFYLVPEDYLTQGGGSNETGVLLDTGKGNAEFKKADVYYRNNTTGMAYLDTNAFKEGSVLIKPDSDSTYKLGETEHLNGVYNINKGYAVFKQIRVLCESEEYYVIESGNSYGLSNFDHIALDAENVVENDVVF